MSAPRSNASFREVNLEHGKPFVDAALKHLTAELKYCASAKIPVLKIIHGYGSSGTGGRIRIESRRYLARAKERRDIKTYITGEKFSIFDEDTRTALSLCSDLRRDRDLERHNNGVTFIVL